MGRGEAVGHQNGSHLQVPRFTVMLRSFAVSGSDAQSSIAEQHVQRSALLQQKRAQLAASKPSRIGASELAAAILGPWDRAPKAGRDAYERYLAAVSALLGGEASAAEVQAAAAAAWPTLQRLPPAEQLRGRGSTAALEPIRQQLVAQVGPIEDAALPDLLQQARALAAHQQKQSPAPFSGTTGGLKTSATASPKAQAVPQQQEFGADLEFHQPRLYASADEAVLAMCGAGLGSAEPGQQRLTDAGPSVEHVRDMFAAMQGPTGPSTLGQLSYEEDAQYGPKQPDSKVGAKWLADWCMTDSGDFGDVNSLAMTVASAVLGGRSGDELAAELFNLLGESFVESIQTVVEQRRPLAANLRKSIAALREKEEKEQASGPTYGSTVTVMTSSQKVLDKLARKDRRRAERAGADADLEWLLVNGFEALLEAALEAESASGALNFGNGVKFKLGDGEGLAGRSALPKGTTRKVHKKYEEVFVPAVKTGVPPAGERRVHIEELPEWAQLAFDGYKALNRIQSRIFDKAFGSNENILVCAPTGAGKTNIAMLTVLHEIAANMSDGLIQTNNFKVVYVAPMKALAAEVTAAFSKRLEPLGLVVRELTGDMQLTKREMEETQMIVTTPEKWDVITRKGSDMAVASLVRLLIIDEVHLLNDERGPVIETLVARTQRQVEASQSMIRIVGLSATLPNYKDVASFLGVDAGLFYFDASYRPVPLEMQFVGVSERNILQAKNIMDEVCYEKVIDSLKAGHQAMVFVHSRKDTGKTGRTIIQKAQNSSDTGLFDVTEHPQWAFASRDVKKSRNKELAELIAGGIGMHHAGMLRSDRNLTERLFRDGILKVLCTTATLAWGVNLPAHTVIIKGTQLYDAQSGQFKDLGMLDVQQIFGRAGRPQFEDTGLGIIITSHDKLAHYLGMLTHQLPIESQFVRGLVDNLNAEIVLGTVTNVKEAIAWLSYTYLYVRMMQNPLPYGITWQELTADPRLDARRRSLITDAARQLERSKMARFDERSGQLYVTELGRVASHFYIRHASILVFNEQLTRHMDEARMLSMMAQSSEFENMAVREEELPELDRLLADACPFDARGGPENKHGKVCILIQAFVSRARMDSFSLTADMMYVSTNAPRIARAVFEICLRRGWSATAELALRLCKALEGRLWEHQHPLRQFGNVLSPELLFKLEDRGLALEQLEDMEANEIGAILRHPAAGPAIRSLVDSFPRLHLEAQLHPITRSVLRVMLKITPEFAWHDRAHGGALRWHLWVEDSDSETIYHTETWSLTKKMAREPSHMLAFTIPVREPLPTQYYIRAVSDTWHSAESLLALSFKGLLLPGRHPPHTELLDLDPLPVSALDNAVFQSLYRFTHFNAIQTQIFHTMYHTDENVLLGAPTGSGKTISAELAVLRCFAAHPGRKIIYIAPLKALVRERMEDWGKGLCRVLGKKIVELTGDFTPDVRALQAADVIITTPEKWDGISRNWQNRGYVQKVGLLVLDEIHLLGNDRGPILEVIVSRMRYIAAHTARDVRFVGLSTAVANAQDLADWLGIGPKGMFNFKPSVRPVPLEAHIQGYPGKFYCPRMATMNKPAYAAIQTHSPIKPVLVFVSSRRQTRLTALDLLGFAAADERPRQFVHMPDEELEAVLSGIKDASLRHTLQFGIGLHHAGLTDTDRKVVEALFVAGKIQVLVATSTLAWGVNTPAHLVVIKGTEYFDAPSRRYVDFPITDVLQMMGRAGRPQYDRHGIAVIMVAEPKKSFYKKFLYEPFPVESGLAGQLAEHFNAEVVAGTIASAADAVDYLTWTFLFRRLLANPSYYDLEGTDADSLNAFLSALVEDTLGDLEEAGCMVCGDEGEVATTAAGRIASVYYLQHTTMAFFAQHLGPNMDLKAVLGALCGASEYDELPVRHNEDQLNLGLSSQVRWPIDRREADDPHAKANLLLQAHMGRTSLPISDYVTDTRSVLDNSLRVLQAMVDICAEAGWLSTALNVMHMVQALMQARWPDDSPFTMLPGTDAEAAAQLAAAADGGGGTLPSLLKALRDRPADVQRVLRKVLGNQVAEEAARVCGRLPLVDVRWRSPRPAPPARVDDDEEEEAEQSEPALLLPVELRRLPNASGGRSGSQSRVYAPRFPKVKEEGWWLVLSDAVDAELLALKRLSFAGERTTAKLAFLQFGADGGQHAQLRLRLVSDSYLGLDQSFTVEVGSGKELGSGKEAAAAAAPQRAAG